MADKLRLEHLKLKASLAGRQGPPQIVLQNAGLSTKFRKMGVFSLNKRLGVQGFRV